MTMSTQFRNWRVLPRLGGSADVGVGVGAFHYRLESSIPVRGTGPERQPFTIDAPTAAPRFVRQPVRGGPVSEVVARPRQISGLTSPRLDTSFGLSFAGAGAGPGVGIAGISTPDDPSSTGTLLFSGLSRAAQDFIGEGFILEGSISDPTLTTAGFQIIVLDCPATLIGGTDQLVRRIQAYRSRPGGLVPFLREVVGPLAAITAVAGIGTGFSVGLTLYTGVFMVTERSI